MAKNPSINIHPLPSEDKVQHHLMSLHLIIPCEIVTRRLIVLDLHSRDEEIFFIYQTAYKQTAY